MSQTYEIYCKDCKKKYWAGQNNYLYDFKKITKFLFLHQRHELIFLNDLDFDYQDNRYNKLRDFKDETFEKLEQLVKENNE